MKEVRREPGNTGRVTGADASLNSSRGESERRMHERVLEMGTA